MAAQEVWRRGEKVVFEAAQQGKFTMNRNDSFDPSAQRTCSSTRRRGQIWRGEMKTREITWHGQMFGVHVSTKAFHVFFH
jgi:hypothetical protein